MRKVALFMALLLAASHVSPAPEAGVAMASHAGPPPYQMRAPLPPGDRLAGGRNGAALFTNRCGTCHLTGGMGTNLLTKQRMLAGEPAENGLLANREDLTPDYVMAVVRQGKVAMPRLSRTEVTDPELEAIAAYLGKQGL